MEAHQPDDTVNWIQAFREGREQALSHFFKLHGQSLIYFAGKLIVDETEAEDIVADVFYKILGRYFGVAAGQNQVRLFDATKPALAPYKFGL